MVARQEEQGLLDDESEEREELYERAQRVAAALASTGDDLRDLICDINEGAGAPPRLLPLPGCPVPEPADCALCRRCCGGRGASELGVASTMRHASFQSG